MDCPKLRKLDIRPVSQNGETYFLLRDPLQITEKQLMVPQPLALALAFCDGNHTVEEIATKFAEHYGFPMKFSYLQEMIETLDRTHMLESQRYASALEKTLQEYRGSAYRTPFLAGPSYPADPAALSAYLNQFLMSATQSQPRKESRNATCCGLLSPHIDFPRGGHIYANVWQGAAEVIREADLVVMFGTDHYGSDLVTLTRQNYATPYGVLPTSLPIVDRLAKEIGESVAFAGELRHRGEHSLELVAVWLHHMRGGSPCELVPILVGGFHPFMDGDERPENHVHLQRLLKILEEQCRGKKVLVVASGDLSHVGPAFGGEPLTSTGRKQLCQQDEELLQQVKRGDASEFFERIRRHQDQNNVCGVSPIYLTMQLLKMMNGTVTAENMGYDTCPADNKNSSVVTICGIMFF